MPSLVPVLAFLDVGGPEILVILVLVLVLFGGKRMPELARNLGKSMRDFKRAREGVEDQIKRALEEDPVPARPKKLRRPKPEPATTSPEDTTVYDSATAAAAGVATAGVDQDAGVANESIDGTVADVSDDAPENVDDHDYVDPHEDEYIGGTAESDARAHGIEEQEAASEGVEPGDESVSDAEGSSSDAEKKKSAPNADTSDGGGI